MCRFVAYTGPPVNLHEMLYEPEHSLIHQSVHAHEREEPLNGDGWGVGWYNPRLRDHPATYRTLHPAWSDENMRHVSPLVRTPTFLAHVRAASPGLPVQRLNCHPFRGGRHTHKNGDELSAVEQGRRRLLFMHNGQMGAYEKITRRLQEELDDDIFFGIEGSTDTEHVFAALQQQLGDAAADPSLYDLAQATSRTLDRIQQLQEAIGEPDATTKANFCLTDGSRLVATRYAHPIDETPESLYVGTAGGFYCQQSEYRVQQPEAQQAVLISSEKLWEDDRVWEKVPANHLVKVAPDRSIEYESLT